MKNLFIDFFDPEYCRGVWRIIRPYLIVCGILAAFTLAGAVLP